MDKPELIKYIRDTMAEDSSPAEEVIVIDDTICVRIDGELIGIKLVESIEISLGKDKKAKVTKKNPAKKKSKKPTKKTTPEKPVLAPEKPTPKK
ncbi:hypothetical protein KA005_09345 [bacterium]|nr:hypothetical protein [bacterium]